MPSPSGAATTTTMDAELLLDRLLSASAPADCLDSLERLGSSCRHRLRPKSAASKKDPKTLRPSQAEELDEAKKEAEREESERQGAVVDALLGNGAALNALCSLVASSTLPSQHDRAAGMEVEGGDIAACELLLAALPPPSDGAPTSGGSNSNNNNSQGARGTTTEALREQRERKRRVEHVSKTLLHFHERDDGRKGEGGPDAGPKRTLTSSLLDCLCASPSDGSTAPAPSVYARVLSLQMLQSLLSASPGALREQLMNAPDGINRLVDLLGHGSMGSTQESAAVPEEVRNEAILFLTSLASSSSMMAKLMAFSEGYDRALKIALELGGGLSSGSTIAMDCLELCLALSHADEVARELFLGGGDGRGNLDRLARLVDLRGGERFRDRERNLWWDRELKEKKKRKSGNSSSGKDSAAETKSDVKQAKESTGRKGKRGKKAKDDDLDDILRGASAPSSTTAETKKSEDPAKPDRQPQQSQPTVPEGPPIPYLTPNEAKVVDSVFKLLLVLLKDGDDSSATARQLNEASRAKRRGRAKTIVSHDLARYIVDCALYTLPPPGVDFVSAVPPPRLQQDALVTMAVLGSLGDTVISEEEYAKSEGKKSDADAAKRKKEADEESTLQTKLLFETAPIYLRGNVTAIDRLMYLCCTGAYIPHPDSDDLIDEEERPEAVASLLSTYSVSAFRSCLPSETACRMVLHALAPPPPEEADGTGAPAEPPVVTRLVTTLADNLRFLQSQQHNDRPNNEIPATDVHRATIGASGSAGALGVFLTKGEGDATREMLLRLAPPPPPRPQGPESPTSSISAEPSSSNLIDFVLQHVATYDPNAQSDAALHASSAYICQTLLGLLCEWVVGMPRAVTEVLSSPSSVSVGVLVRSRRGKDTPAAAAAAGAVPALSGLLLGLCLEYMADSDGNAVSSAGEAGTGETAWTRGAIMDTIHSLGVGRYFGMIDEWKSRPLPLPYCNGKERSDMERRAFASWYGRNVTLVRRRVVAALAGSGGDDDSDSDAEGTDGNDKSSARSLRRMVSSQAREVEELQAKLEEAMLTISSQSTQIRELKRVAELGASAEANDMISEYTERSAELDRTRAELRKEAERRAKDQEEALAARDGEVEAAKRELEEARARADDLRRDNEALADEMAGLSSAYDALERQYHRNNSGVGGGGSSTSETPPTETTAGGEAAAEDGGIRGQRSSPSVPGGEAAAEDPSRANSEVQSLRDENARLREEGRAANEWMQMAVSRMEEMTGENEELARSLEEARAAGGSAASSRPGADSSALRSELDGLREELRGVREGTDAELRAKEEELSRQQSLVKQLGDQIEEMKASATTVNEDSSAAASTAQVEELRKELAGRTEELEGLRKANSEAQEWMANAVTHVDSLTKEKEELLAKLQASTEAVATTPTPTAESDSRIAELEESLLQVTSERDELRTSLAKVSEESSSLEGLKQELASQGKELEGLRKANAEAQEWMAQAVTHAEMQAEEIREKDEQLAKLKAGEAVAATSTDDSESKIEGLERSLSEVTSERDVLRTSLGKMKEDMSALREANEGLQKAADESQVRDSSETDALKAELDQVKAENSTLASNLSEFQSWSETAQSRLAEVEAKLQETVTERDGLKAQLETNAAGIKPESDDSSDQITALQEQIRQKDEQIREKAEQLERMQDQLIEDAQESDDRIEQLTLEKERLSSAVTEKQAEIDSLNAGKSEAEMRAGEAQRRIAELEAAKSAAEAQVDKLMTLEGQGTHDLDEQIITITAERDDLRSQLEDLTEENEETQRALERTGMENGNLSARLRAIEQDNKSLEYQFSELEGKIKEKEGLVAAANDEKSALQGALDEIMKKGSEEAESWQQQAQALQGQLEQQEKDAKETVAQWEARCSSLEGSGEDVIRQWEERVQSLQDQLDTKEKEAAEAIAQWEARCTTLEESGGDVVRQWEERVQATEAEVTSLLNQLEQQEKEAAEAIAQWEKRCSSLEESGGDVVRQWEERVQALESDIASLSNQLEQQEREAAEAIAQWETRCSTLEESGESVIHQWQERVQSLEGDVGSLEQQVGDKETLLAIANEEKTTLKSALDEMKTSSEETVRLWQERAQSLEAEVTSLSNQLEQQEKEAADAVAQWEARCATLEESGGDAIRQWEERVQSLQAELEESQNQMDQQEKEAAEAIAQWEARCSALEESGGDVIRQWEERVQELEEKEKQSADAVAQWEAKCSEVSNTLSATQAEMEAISVKKQDLEGSLATAMSQLEKHKKDIEDGFQKIESMSMLLKDKEEALMSSDDQVSELAKELLETQKQLEANIHELDSAIQEHESREHDAAEAITQWEARCATLNEKIHSLELQIAASNQDNTVADLQKQVSDATAKLEAIKAAQEKTQGHLNETKELLAQRQIEWKEKEANFTTTIGKLENACLDHQKKIDQDKSSLDSLKEKLSASEANNRKFLNDREGALKEAQESEVIVLELQEELKHAKEELQSFATDQFTVKATEMATHALRQQMVEIRSQYAIDKEALTTEREARRVAEEEVDRLKSDLTLLAQATEYDEGVDVHVRKVAKRVAAENVKAERKEMEELRSTLERLREELGASRWKERESEEKASNARLQMSILEQEVSAAKTDLALLEEAMEDLENSKIEMSVSLDYRVQALENDREMTEQTYEEEIHGIKAELAQANQERDSLAHKLEQSEKANAALVYSTSHDGTDEENASEVIKLQLERAQLLAKINDMGADSERRVREAVAAQASSSETELIVERQSRKSVESSLADALSELEEVKTLMSEHTSKTKNGELGEKQRMLLEDLEESLEDIRLENDELLNKNKVLEAQLDTADKENKSAIDDLTTRLQKAEARLRSEERESRFEAAIAAEIANLRASTQSASNGTPKNNSQALILRGIDQNTQPGAFFGEGKDTIDRNSAYIIDMYDYVCELKNSITEEREMYKDLLAEHEDLLALLGQAGTVEGIQFSASE